MTVIELMNEFSALEKGQRVFFYADHGQQAEESYSIGEFLYSEGEIYTRDDLVGEWEPEEIDKLERVIVIM